jgi:antitoxin HicB
MKIAKYHSKENIMPIGSSFDEFLEEECIRKETELKAIKEVRSWKFQQEMKENHLSKMM